MWEACAEAVKAHKSLELRIMEVPEEGGYSSEPFYKKFFTAYIKKLYPSLASEEKKDKEQLENIVNTILHHPEKGHLYITLDQLSGNVPSNLSDHQGEEKMILDPMHTKQKLI